MRKIFLLYLLIFLTNGWAQEYAFFHYESKLEQYFKFHPGASKKILYVNMDRNDIVFNSLFDLDEKTTQLIIPISGFYEISGYFHFDLRTGNVKNSRAGINFGFVQIQNGIEDYIAGTRISYTETNQDGFLDIYIDPTIVYLEKGVIIAPVMSTGLLDKPIVNAYLGCERTNKDCIAFQWSLKRISNEASSQKYF